MEKSQNLGSLKKLPLLNFRTDILKWSKLQVALQKMSSKLQKIADLLKERKTYLIRIEIQLIKRNKQVNPCDKAMQQTKSINK